MSCLSFKCGFIIVQMNNIIMLSWIVYGTCIKTVLQIQSHPDSNNCACLRVEQLSSLSYVINDMCSRRWNLKVYIDSQSVWLSYMYNQCKLHTNFQWTLMLDHKVHCLHKQFHHSYISGEKHLFKPLQCYIMSQLDVTVIIIILKNYGSLSFN